MLKRGLLSSRAPLYTLVPRRPPWWPTPMTRTTPRRRRHPVVPSLPQSSRCATPPKTRKQATPPQPECLGQRIFFSNLPDVPRGVSTFKPMPKPKPIPKSTPWSKQLWNIRFFLAILPEHRYVKLYTIYDIYIIHYTLAGSVHIMCLFFLIKTINLL